MISSFIRRAAAGTKQAPAGKIPFEAPIHSLPPGPTTYLPSMEIEQRYQPIAIPISPDNYTVSDSVEDSYPQYKKPIVITVASVSTHIEPPTAPVPTSNLEHEDNNSEYIENNGFISSFFSDMTGGTGFKSEEGAKREKYDPSRALSNEERGGLAVLAGIVFSGFVLGRIMTPKKKEVTKA